MKWFVLLLLLVPFVSGQDCFDSGVFIDSSKGECCEGYDLATGMVSGNSKPCAHEVCDARCLPLERTECQTGWIDTRYDTCCEGYRLREDIPFIHYSDIRCASQNGYCDAECVGSAWDDPLTWFEALIFIPLIFLVIVFWVVFAKFWWPIFKAKGYFASWKAQMTFGLAIAGFYSVDNFDNSGKLSRYLWMIRIGLIIYVLMLVILIISFPLGFDLSK